MGAGLMEPTISLTRRSLGIGLCGGNLEAWLVAAALICVLLSGFASAQVKTGLDVLIEQNFAPLAGKCVGLATNPTGVTRDGRRNIDVFAHAHNLKLTAIFSFEHGINGDREDTHIDNSIDESTGVPIYSLYNED